MKLEIKKYLKFNLKSCHLNIGRAKFIVLLQVFFLAFSLTADLAHAQSKKPAKKSASKSKKLKIDFEKDPSAPNNRKSFDLEEDPTPVSAKGLVIKSIEVQGQKKIEKDAILNRLISKVDTPYVHKNIREDVIQLFNSGYFLNVEVDRKIEGSAVTLTYIVAEKPSVVEIVYEGNSELKNEDLAEAAGLKAYELLNMTKLKTAVEKMQKLYEDKGFFLAKIEPLIEEVKKDESVKLTYKIQEGDKVKVKKITLLGINKLKEGFLKSKMFTQEEGFFSGMSGSGAYKQEAFDRDVQILRFTYYNQGYVKAKVERPQVYVTPDKRGIYITIQIEEGDQYYVGEVDFAGDLLFPKAELFETAQIDNSDIFAYDVLQKDLGELQAKYGDLGYAYTNVIPRWSFNEPEKKVNLIFEIDKGNKVYFGKINMVGNSKTRDKVIRREMRVYEGELYHETRRRKSLENIQRLGFFDEVNFKTSTPTDQLDIMNVDVVVKERNTGQVQLTAGYGSATGFTFGGSVQQTNFLGKGQNLGVSLQLTNTSSVYDLTFTEPYFNDTLWSVGFRGFMSSDSGRSDYDVRKTGGSMSLGHPIFEENVRGTLTYGYTNTVLSPIYASGGGLLTDYQLFPLNTAEGDASTLGAAVDYDTRNDRMRPTKGTYMRAAYNHTGLVGGNLKYYRFDGTARYFKNIFWDVVFRNSLTYGKIGSLDPDRDPPFNELFLLGGPYSLRGYRYARVGKMIRSQNIYDRIIAGGDGATLARERSMRFYGGAQQIQYQGELLFPLIKEADMFGVAFYDIGQAEDQITDTRFFSDVGFGVRWFSPIGPLRFEWGFPLDRDSLYHESVVFEFSIGTPF